MLRFRMASLIHITLPAFAVSALAVPALGAPLARADARGAVLAPDLVRLARARPSVCRVIVQTAAVPTATDLRAARSVGARVTSVFRAVSGFGAAVPSSSLSRLAARPGVRRISLDRPVAAFRTAPMGRKPARWDDAARSVGADQCWVRTSPITGRGVGVAILDTGILPLPDIQVAGWADLVNGRPVPYDDNGHGTHVAGIVAGSGAMSGGINSRFLGVAPNAHLVGVKVLDAGAVGYVSTVIQGLDWCLAHRAEYNIRVVNLSLGQPVSESWTTDPLCRAAERAVAAGLVVVAAAGNTGDGYGGIESPGNSPAVLTVGAARTSASPCRSDDEVAGYSSRGPTALDFGAKPDLLAPGNRIVSLRAPGSRLDTLYPDNRVMPYLYGGAPGDAPRYFILSGTSMAAPVVSGIAALVLQRRPDLAPNAVKAALMVSAQPIGGYDPVRLARVERYDWMVQGAGYANAAGAVRAAAILPDGTQAAPLLEGWGEDAIQGEPVAWGRSVLWGNAVTEWNPSNFRRADWNRSVLWGDSTFLVNGEGVDVGDAVFATSVLWGNRPATTTGGLNVLVTGEADPS